MKNPLLLIIAFLFITFLSNGQDIGVCTNCPLMLPELEEGEVYFHVDATNEYNLSTEGNGVKLIKMGFTHQYIGDLELYLISPSGQTVQLMGPHGIAAIPLGSGNTDGSMWDITYVPSYVPAVPDGEHSVNFTNFPEVWGINGNFTGSYYPYEGKLDDFNEGSINGTWTIYWKDYQEYDVGVFDGYSIEFLNDPEFVCNTCDVVGGALPSNPIQYEEGGEELKLGEFLFPEFAIHTPTPADFYGYTYLVVQNDVIVAVTEEADLTMLSSGDYAIWGLSYAKGKEEFLPTAGKNYATFVQEVKSRQTKLCADISDNSTPITILTAPTSTLEVELEGLDEVSITVFNLKGQVSLAEKKYYNPTKDNIGLQSLPKGIYFVKLVTADKQIVKKVVTNG